MRIMGFMPTLGRPELVEEILRMWELQTYPDRELLVYDTANQMPEISGDRWRIVHQGCLPWSMGTTCNVGIRMSDAPLIARIDDDDQYLPWHLEACVEALRERQWCCPSVVWDGQYGKPPMLGRTSRGELAQAAYAGAWAFRREAFEAIGGYREDKFREEECEFRDRLAKLGPPGDTISPRFPMPSYYYAANHKRVVHYGQCTDDERRACQRKEWPKWETITPRWPQNFLQGLPDDAKVMPRRF